MAPKKPDSQARRPMTRGQFKLDQMLFHSSSSPRHSIQSVSNAPSKESQQRGLSQSRRRQVELWKAQVQPGCPSGDRRQPNVQRPKVNGQIPDTTTRASVKKRVRSPENDDGRSPQLGSFATEHFNKKFFSSSFDSLSPFPLHVELAATKFASFSYGENSPAQRQIRARATTRRRDVTLRMSFGFDEVRFGVKKATKGKLPSIVSFDKNPVAPVVHSNHSSYSSDSADDDATVVNTPESSVGGLPQEADGLTTPRAWAPRRHEGFGFDYSDPEFQSFDTQMSDVPPSIGPHNNYGNLKPDSSFDDMLVVCPISEEPLFSKPKVYKCTRASHEDTINVSQACEMLLAKYEESEERCELVLNRLERMVAVQAKKPKGSTLSTIECAEKLLKHFKTSKDDRIDTGEVKHVVLHDIEWAQWLVMATKTHVMHLKTRSCQCRPGWDERSNDKAPENDKATPPQSEPLNNFTHTYQVNRSMELKIPGRFEQ